jgi:hypothetical protein
MIPREVGQTSGITGTKKLSTTPFIVGSPVSTLIKPVTTTVRPVVQSAVIEFKPTPALKGLGVLSGLLPINVNPVTIKNTATGTTTTGYATTLTEAQKNAISQASQLKQTAWINANPTVQKNLALLRSAKTIADINKAGNVIVPAGVLTAGGVSLPSDMAQIQALMKTNQAQQNALSTYYTKESGYMTELQKGTVKYGDLLSSYSDLQSKYENLVNNPPQQNSLFNFPDIGGWFSKNWKYIALVVGAIIALLVLPSWLRRSK